MQNDFAQMVERIISASYLEISEGKLELAISDEANHDQEIVESFLNRFQPIWINWKKAKGPHLISPFLEVVGPQIFIDFLTKLFCYNPDELNVTIKKGNSNVDAQINLIYSFNEEELKILKKLKNKYGLEQIADENEMAKILFSNCIKSLTKFLSNIINIRYRLFTSQINMNVTENDILELNIIFDGRIG